MLIIQILIFLCLLIIIISFIFCIYYLIKIFKNKHNNLLTKKQELKTKVAIEKDQLCIDEKEYWRKYWITYDKIKTKTEYDKFLSDHQKYMSLHQMKIKKNMKKQIIADTSPVTSAVLKY